MMLPGPSPTTFARFPCEPRRTAAEMASIDATRETARTPTRAAYVGDVVGDGAAVPRAAAPPPMPTPSLAERGGGPRARGPPAKPVTEPPPAAAAAPAGVVGAVAAPRGNAPDCSSSCARRAMSRGWRFAGFAGEPSPADAGPSASARMVSSSVFGFLALPAMAGDCPLPGHSAVLGNYTCSLEVCESRGNTTRNKMVET
jgi:hypothetical protein